MEVTLERAASDPRNFDGAPSKFKAKSINTIQTLLESGVPCVVKLPKPEKRWGAIDKINASRDKGFWDEVLTCVGKEPFSSMGGFVFLAKYDSPLMYWELREGEKIFRLHQGEWHHRHADKMCGLADYYHSETLQFNDIFRHLQELGYQLPTA